MRDSVKVGSHLHVLRQSDGCRPLQDGPDWLLRVPPGMLSLALLKLGKRSKLPGVAHRPTSLVAMELGTTCLMVVR